MTNGTDQKPRAEAPPASETFDRAALVARALGFRNGLKPNESLGDSLTRLTVWTQHELNAIYIRAGGTLTTRPVQRSTHDGESTWSATEITLTVHVPSIGDVQVVTDWDEECGGRDLPVMRALACRESIA
ncbi:hypothetical protein [Streptomyces sp. NPDC046821]|uniref:hypothetical protein n=1 Tax=Streptomyces sp. NPDC046821 TaxID=3154702 RepID=UPI0033ED839F